MRKETTTLEARYAVELGHVLGLLPKRWFSSLQDASGSRRRRLLPMSPMAHLTFAMTLLLAVAADARPPQDADPALAPWFQSLHQPGTGLSCCSISDCRPTEYRMNGDDYETWVEGTWLVVPRDKILQRTDNPTGHAIVCWTPQRGIMCFVRGAET